MSLKAFLWSAGGVLLLCAALYGAGFWQGRSEGLARGLAARDALKIQYERQYTDALLAMQEKQREDARRAFLADLALQKQRSANAREKEDFLAKLAAHNGPCVFGSDFIGLWNAAISAAPCALPSAADPGGADAAPGTCAGTVRGKGQ